MTTAACKCSAHLALNALDVDLPAELKVLGAKAVTHLATA